MIRSAAAGSVLLFLAVLMSAAPAAHAAILDVPGSYSTIPAAITAASNGDVILVSPGTYTQNVSFGGKQLALRSVAGPGSTIISVSGGKGVVLGGDSELSGFTITGASSSFGAGVEVSGAGTLIRGNIFDGNAQTAGGYGAGIGGNSASPIIDGNIFRNHTADGQYLSGVVSFINGSSPKIINNVFVDNTTRAINFVLPSGNSPVVVNNTFVRNTVAIKYGSFSLTTFRNNVLANNGIGLLLDYPGALPTWEFNDVFGNSTNYSGGMPDLTGIGGNISQNPLFVGGNDFRPQPGSPLIDSGSPLLAPTHDLDGQPRPLGAGFDMGAFEVPEPSATAVMSLIALSALRRKSRGR